MTWDQLQTDEKHMWRSEMITRAFTVRAQEELTNSRRATVDDACDMNVGIDEIRFQAGVQAGMEALINLLTSG